MRIVMDTNVVLKAFFIGGPAQRIMEFVVRDKLPAFATPEIVSEYEAAVAKLTAKKEGGLRPDLLLPFTTRLHMVEPKPRPALCRHPGDNKFLACALDANATYIVTAFRDMRRTGEGNRVSMMTDEGLSVLLGLCEL
ncbi:MAG: putative toxin-antitoxin system toxin component, PIN family [Schwartzia sp.]|nr:putative toxin-antitoxin system toxin component, PIN family [Schwartzia sp. (in: firmicutes)]